MAARNNRSPPSSRSVSPDPFSDQYDPFDPPLDPIEMTSFSPRRSTEAQSTHRTVSPENSRSGSPPLTGAYFSTTRGNGGNNQYAPLQESERRVPTLRSGAASLYSLNSLNHYKTMDPDTQKLVDRRAGAIAEWSIHWITPAIIIALFVAGMIAAVGHHLFYVHLDGRPAEDQLKMIRYGTALAFFVKSTLVGCVIMCYRQRIWHTFRVKSMTIKAIDGLFSATEDPTQFWNWEMIRNGKLATFMALCGWLIPIASVLSPASLTAESHESYNQTFCPSVASLNFSHESLYNFRNEANYPGSSLVYYNTTDTAGKADGYFDYYDQPSKNARRLAVTSAYLRKPATNPDASLNSCGERWNCTYSINFVAPGYKCDELASSQNPDGADSAPFNLSILAPQGDSLYYASVDLNDYVSPQIATGEDGVPIPKPPYPASLGVFESEPVLWIGYAIKTNETYPDNSPYKKWGSVHEPKIFKCVAYHTNYTFEMRYNDTVQVHERKQRDFLTPLIDTTVSINPDNATDLVASPESNYIRPSSNETYKLTASYHAIGSLLRNFLRGQISLSDKGYFVTKSDISETRLMEAATSYPVADLMNEIPSVFEDMLITLLSEPHLVIADNQNVPCEKSRWVNVFVYHRQNLWVGYALAVAVTFGFIIVGAWSIFQNGVASDTQFSRIMVTTRNPTIDRLSVGACLGGDPFPKELRETKLRFGVLLEEDPREGPLGKVEHCCFGAAGETKDIVKYGTYAGLKKWRKDIEEEVGDVGEKAALLKDYEDM